MHLNDGTAEVEHGAVDNQGADLSGIFDTRVIQVEGSLFLS